MIPYHVMLDASNNSVDHVILSGRVENIYLSYYFIQRKPSHPVSICDVILLSIFEAVFPGT